MPIFSSALVMAPLPIFGLYIEGTPLDDTLYGTNGADEIHGRGGNDYLVGGAGNDLLFGEEGNDDLVGGTGDDVLNGGTGNDDLIGGTGADQLIGGDGFDTASYSGSSAGVWIDLNWNYASGGEAQGDTFSGIEKIVGSNHGDVLVAAGNGAAFDGGAGNDSLRGGAGIDVLTGGSGDDYLTGGLNVDVLTGGAGADIFEFNAGDGADVVLDFQQGVDKIALANGFHPTVMGPHGHGSFGRDGQLLKGVDLSQVLPSQVGGYYPGGDQLFYDTDDHQLYQLSVDWATLTTQGELLATFANGVDLQTSDFIFV
jgi:Ca2+-binding RTX toxin-like protein